MFQMSGERLENSEELWDMDLGPADQKGLSDMGFVGREKANLQRAKLALAVPRGALAHLRQPSFGNRLQDIIGYVSHTTKRGVLAGLIEEALSTNSVRFDQVMVSEGNNSKAHFRIVLPGERGMDPTSLEMEV